jgi:hypothetical protein
MLGRPLRVAPPAAAPAGGGASSGSIRAVSAVSVCGSVYGFVLLPEIPRAGTFEMAPFLGDRGFF